MSKPQYLVMHPLNRIQWAVGSGLSEVRCLRCALALLHIRYSGFMPRRLKHCRITTAVASHNSNRLDCSGLPITCIRRGKSRRESTQCEG